MAEKFGMVKDSNVLLSMRDLRNKIAHEYSLKDITKLFSDVAAFADILCEIIDDMNGYIENLQKKLKAN